MDNFGDRMKEYEKVFTRKLTPLLPICVRLDGKSFSKWTKNLGRPFDLRMIKCMQETTQNLVRISGARIGYTQSDEISLIIYSDKYTSQVYFDRKIQKIISVLSSEATLLFNNAVAKYIPEKKNNGAVFDCRVWQVPNLTEAANVILWREQDATKNSISMAARHFYSHKELMNKNGKQMQEMLFKAGVNWNDYPSAFKRGTFFQKKKVQKVYSKQELSALPDGHAAKKNPDLKIERNVIKMLDMPPFGSVSNRVAVIFKGAEPITHEK